MERCEALELGPGPDEFINVAVELILNIITASIRLAPGVCVTNFPFCCHDKHPKERLAA